MAVSQSPVRMRSVYAEYEALTSVGMKTVISWDVRDATPCSLIQVQQRFGRQYWSPSAGKKSGQYVVLKCLY